MQIIARMFANQCVAVAPETANIASKIRYDFMKDLLQQRLTRWKIVRTLANVVGSGLAALACLALRPGCKGPLWPGAVGKANILIGCVWRWSRRRLSSATPSVARTLIETRL